jgi:hypothetical protein
LLSRSSPAIVLALCVACAPPPVQRRAADLSPPAIETLIADLPGATPDASASALEARLRRSIDGCASARVDRVSTTEVHADAGDGCPGARGAMSATFALGERGVVVTIQFQRWSLADGDVLNGSWHARAIDHDASFRAEQLPFTQRAVTDTALPPDPDPPPPLPKSAAERCLDGLGTGILASGKLVAGAPMLLAAWPLLLAAPVVGLAAGCK